MAEARVPASPSVMPSGAVDAFINPRVSAEAFGAGAAEGKARFADTLAKVGTFVGNAIQTQVDKRKNLTNQLMVQDASSQFSRAAAESYINYSQKLGKSAQDGLPQYQQDLEQQYQTIYGTLPDDESRLRFASSTRGTADSYSIRGLEHSTTQLNAWEKDSAGAFQTEQQTQAVLAAGDPAQLQDFIHKGADSVLQYNINNNMDPATANKQVRAYVGDSYYFVIKTLTEQGRPLEAQKIFDQFKSEMDGPNIVKAQTTLSGPIRDAVTGGAVQDVLRRNPRAPSGPRADYVIGDSHAGGAQQATHLPGFHADGVSIASGAMLSQLRRVPDGGRAYLFGGTNDAANSKLNFDTTVTEAMRLKAEADRRGIELIIVGPPQTNQPYDKRAAELDQRLSAALGPNYRSSRGRAQDKFNPANPGHFTVDGYRELFGATRVDTQPRARATPPQVAAASGPRASQAVSFFMGKGLTQEQAAGIVGNLLWESRLNPSIHGDKSIPGHSVGIAQWNRERLAALKAFSPTGWQNFDTQLAFLWHELNTSESDVLGALKNAKTVDDAVAAFIGFERPMGWSAANPRGGHAYGHRAALAAKLLGQEVPDYAPEAGGEVATGGAPPPGVAASVPPPVGTALVSGLETAAPLGDLPQPAPVEYGMPEKGEAVAALREQFKDNPEYLTAALTKLNAEYTRFDTETATGRAETKQQVDNATAAVGDPEYTGKLPDFPTEEVRYFYQPHVAEQMIAQFETASMVRSAVIGLRFETPQAMDAIGQDIHSGVGPFSDTIRAATGGDSFQAQQVAMKLFESMQSNRAAKLTGANADPAAYVRNEPTVATAWTQFNAEPTAEGFRRYAAAANTVQDRLGLAPEERRLLTRTEAQIAAQNLLKPTTNAAQNMRDQQKMFGPYWNQYFSDVAGMGKLPTQYQMIGLLPAAADQDLLARALRDQASASASGKEFKWEDALGMSPDNTAPYTTTIARTIDNDSKLQRYLHSQIQSNGVGGAEQVTEVLDAMHTLGYASAFYNHDPNGAATYALNAFLGQFEFMPLSDAVIPAENSADIKARAQDILDNLTPSDLNLERPAIGGIGMPSEAEYVGQVKAAPMWITNQQSTGLVLMSNGGQVYWRDGSEVFVPFEKPEGLWMNQGQAARKNVPLSGAIENPNVGGFDPAATRTPPQPVLP